MLPEMAFGYAVGMVPSAALTGVHLSLHHRKIHSPEMRRLQENLGKVGLFWCETESRIRPLKPESLQKDFAKYQRSVILLGGLCLFLSWLGFLIQLGIMASIRYLAISRMEKRLFQSPLIDKALSASEVQKQIDLFREADPGAFESLR